MERERCERKFHYSSAPRKEVVPLSLIHIFAQIAGRFHLIEAPTRTIYLPVGAGAPLCERLQKGEVSRTLLRKLGQFSVACYEPQFRALDDAGALALLPDGSAILMDLSKYDEKTGLAMNVETGVGIFI